MIYNIERAWDINYLIKYGRVVFNVKDLAQYYNDVPKEMCEVNKVI